MTGGFHLLMIPLGVIGARFSEAGLEELAIQSEVVAKGSIDKVLDGKNYNRAVRFYKTTYEAVTRLLVDAFKSSLPENAESMLSDEKKQIEKLKLDVCQDEVERVLDRNEYTRWMECFHQFVIDLKVNGSDLAKFWLS